MIDIATKQSPDCPDESKRVQASPSELNKRIYTCLLYTSDADDELTRVNLEGCLMAKKETEKTQLDRPRLNIDNATNKSRDYPYVSR